MDKRQTMVEIKELSIPSYKVYSLPSSISAKLTLSSGSYSEKQTNNNTILAKRKSVRSISVPKLSCNMCRRRFPDRITRLQHYQDIHKMWISSLDENKKMTYRCHACSKLLKSPNAAFHHYIQQHTGTFKCHKCSKVLKTLVSLKLHKDVCLNKHARRDFSCLECNKNFITKRQLYVHNYVCHSTQTFACTFAGCILKFRYKGNLDKHIQSHGPKKRFVCTVEGCQYAGQTKQSLQVHMHVHGAVSRTFSCEYCVYRATTASNLRRHVRIHTSANPYHCPYCTFTTQTINSLSQHILETKKHPGLYVYQCLWCSFASNISAPMRHHLINNHDDTLTTEQKRMIVRSVSQLLGIYRPCEDLKQPLEDQCVKQPIQRNPRKVRSNISLENKKLETNKALGDSCSTRNDKKCTQKQMTTNLVSDTSVLPSSHEEAALSNVFLNDDEASLLTDNPLPPSAGLDPSLLVPPDWTNGEVYGLDESLSPLASQPPQPGNLTANVIPSQQLFDPLAIVPPTPSFTSQHQQSQDVSNQTQPIQIIDLNKMLSGTHCLVLSGNNKNTGKSRTIFVNPHSSQRKILKQGCILKTIPMKPVAVEKSPNNSQSVTITSSISLNSDPTHSVNSPVVMSSSAEAQTSVASLPKSEDVVQFGLAMWTGANLNSVSITQMNV